MSYEVPQGVIQYQLDHAYQDKGPGSLAVICVFGFLALLCLIARIANRVKQSAGLWWDDYLMIMAGLLSFIEVLAFIEIVHYGYGKHEFTIPEQNTVPLLKWAAADEVVFALALGFARWSILALIARVFTTRSRYLRYGIWAVAIYNALWIIGNNTAIGVQCSPFSRFWSLTDPCSLSRTQTIATSSLSIVGDLLVIALPQHAIWSLQMSLRKKIAVTALMALGLFCSIAGAVRIAVSADITPYDATYTAILPAVFSVLEPLVAIICGCLPCMHGVLVVLFDAASAPFSMASRLITSNRSQRSQRSQRSERSGISSGVRNPASESWQRLDNPPKTDASAMLAYDEEARTGSAKSIPLGEIRKTTTVDVSHSSRSHSP